MHNERHEELVALAALGLPHGDEGAEYARLLEEGCAECERLLPQLRLAAAALAVSAPPREPRPSLRAELLASLGPARLPGRRAPVAGWAFAAAAALLFVMVLLDDARLRRQREELRTQNVELAGQVKSSLMELSRRELRARVIESDDVKIVFLGGQGTQPKANAKVFWSERANARVLVVGGLKPLPTAQQYQIWMFVDGKPVDQGVFDVDTSGRAIVQSGDLSAARKAVKCAVTIEPRGGLPQPSGPIVLFGTVS